MSSGEHSDYYYPSDEESNAIQDALFPSDPGTTYRTLREAMARHESKIEQNDEQSQYHFIDHEFTIEPGMEYHIPSLATNEEVRKFVDAFYDEPGKRSKRPNRVQAAALSAAEWHPVDGEDLRSKQQFAAVAIRAYNMLNGLVESVASGKNYLTRAELAMYYYPLYPPTSDIEPSREDDDTEGEQNA
jgi:hypothetical protein